MKHYFIKVIFCLILGLKMSFLFGQEKRIGFDIGIGKTLIEESAKVVSPFDKELANYLRLGANYYVTPQRAFFNVRTGVILDHREKNDISLTHIKIPLGLDFSFGKKAPIIVGGGFFASGLIMDNVVDPDFNDTKKRFQLGGFANFGIGYKISSVYEFRVLYQCNLDFTRLYNKKGYSSIYSYPISQKEYDGFIKICLNYKLKID